MEQHLVQVQLGHFRPILFFDGNNVECNREDYVIIEVDRGTEFGRVVSVAGSNEHVSNMVKPDGKIIRKVTEGDLNQIQNNLSKARDAINLCVRKVNERKLDMRIFKSEYTFDCSKIIFYFTADQRVDFRVLVKDLAKIFRVRIELRQIPVRDKAKMNGGYGVCGCELCCSCYIKSFFPLSIKMAKEQALPLNPSRISGVCGRIKCCMAYEFLAYRDMSRGLPRIGDKINTPEGRGRVRDVNILKRIVLVELPEGKVIRIEYAKEQETSSLSNSVTNGAEFVVDEDVPDETEQ
ncbi:MAG: regulatory iron-sulfur-containing complex subunit RicT [Candidatus Omnitrophota bacterium]